LQRNINCSYLTLFPCVITNSTVPQLSIYLHLMTYVHVQYRIDEFETQNMLLYEILIDFLACCVAGNKISYNWVLLCSWLWHCVAAQKCAAVLEYLLRPCSLILYDEAGTKFFWNVATNLWNYTASQPRRQYYSQSVSWELQISFVVIVCSKQNQLIYSVTTRQHTQPSASQYGYVFRSLPRPYSSQHLSAKGTISVHYTLWGPILFTGCA